MDDNSKFLPFLLQEGLDVNNRDAWKYLALLLKILYTAPKSKKIIIQMVKEEFNSTVGFVLDHLRDFQLGNYLIELLSNCFPRKHIDKPGVMMPPVLWPEEPSKNEMIFESLEYPFRGKHGYTQVTNFVWQKFGPQLENTLKIDNISYGTNVSNSNGTKKFRSKKNPKEQEYCYVQVIHDCVYLWDGEGVFLELDRRYVDIVKTLKGYIRMNVKDPSCIRSPDKMWLKLFQRTKWFQLLSEDKSQCEQFLKNINNYRKISEAQTFLLLNHADDDDDDGGDYNESLLTQEVSRKVQSENSQLATPDPSDAKIRTDEWDIDISSELQGTREEKRPKMTPKNVDENSNPLAAEDNKEEEQSPLVLAQKRKMIRETSRTLELLKKEFAQENDVENATIQEIENHAIPERSPSLVITKFENKNQHSRKIPEAFPKTKPVRVSPPQPPTANKGVKSIGKKDINVLDTIFGTPKSTKKEKRQKALNNFRPVIDVPSQDLPKVQTRNDKKKEKALMMSKDSYSSKMKNDSVQINLDKKRKPETNPSKTPLLKKPKPALESAKGSEPPARLQPEKKSATQKQVPAQASAPTPKQVHTNAFADPPPAETNADKSNTSLDSTTIIAPTSNPTPFGFNNAFTDKLQEQIYSSITLFSNELLRKMTIINKELNNKIVKELSEKYQNLFQQLQASFHNDTEEMFHFVGEIKDMLNLPEEELVRFIRTRKFGSQH